MRDGHVRVHGPQAPCLAATRSPARNPVAGPLPASPLPAPHPALPPAALPVPDATTGRSPIGSARSSPPSCRCRYPPGTCPARTDASRSRLATPNAHGDQAKQDQRSAPASPGARNLSHSSRSIRPTRSKTLAAVRLSADNDLGKHAARDLRRRGRGDHGSGSHPSGISPASSGASLRSTPAVASSTPSCSSASRATR